MNGITKMANIEPRTDPIRVGPSLILFCIALPRYEPIAKLTQIKVPKTKEFKKVDS